MLTISIEVTQLTANADRTRRQRFALRLARALAMDADELQARLDTVSPAQRTQDDQWARGGGGGGGGPSRRRRRNLRDTFAPSCGSLGIPAAAF
jgi:hypothetical protein